MSEEIKKFDANDAMKSVKEKIRDSFVSLIPDEQWNEMVKKEIDTYFKEYNQFSNNNTFASSFTKDVQSVLTEEVKVRVKEYLSSNFNSIWDNNGTKENAEQFLRNFGGSKSFIDRLEGISDFVELLTEYGSKVENKYIPNDAHSFEVFSIKDCEDSPSGKQAFIGFKLDNGNFNFTNVPYTEPNNKINYNNYMKKIQEQIKNIKTFFYSMVSSQFKKKRELLTYKIKNMILKFVNNIQDNVLKTYHLCIDFKTLENKPTHYRLELLVEVRSEIELGYLENDCLGSIIGKRFNLTNISRKEIKTNYDKSVIEDSFNQNFKNHVHMKFLFRHWTTDQFGKVQYVNDTTVEKTSKKSYRVNILKSGEMSFHKYEDMFCIEIDTTELTK